MNIGEIYKAVDVFAPFAAQEAWDNSGLLVGAPEEEIDRVLVTLDISAGAVRQAAETGCGLIISHHPVIFSPLKQLTPTSPVYQLVRHGIGAICCHTPLDVAEGGINDLLIGRLRGGLSLSDEVERLDCGRIVTLQNALLPVELAETAKKCLGCPVVRCSAGMEHPVKRLAVCSGSGASMLEELDGRCDAFLTGDVKHDRWYKAQELGIALIDCGHYATEILMVAYVAGKLRAAFPELDVREFVEGEPALYI